MKRLLSVVLALCLMLTLIPFAAAEEPLQIEETGFFEDGAKLDTYLKNKYPKDTAGITGNNTSGANTYYVVFNKGPEKDTSISIPIDDMTYVIFAAKNSRIARWQFYRDSTPQVDFVIDNAGNVTKFDNTAMQEWKEPSRTQAAAETAAAALVVNTWDADPLTGDDAAKIAAVKAGLVGDKAAGTPPTGTTAVAPAADAKLGQVITGNDPAPQPFENKVVAMGYFEDAGECDDFLAEKYGYNKEGSDTVDQTFYVIFEKPLEDGEKYVYDLEYDGKIYSIATSGQAGRVRRFSLTNPAAVDFVDHGAKPADWAGIQLPADSETAESFKITVKRFFGDIANAATATEVVEGGEEATILRSANYAELNAQIAAAEKLNQSSYTDSTAAALKKALQDAKALATNLGVAKQDEVDAAATALKNAIAGLKLKPAPVSAPSRPNPSTGV